MALVATAEFREQLSAWLDKAERGEEVIVVRHGRPSVRLTPVADDQPTAAAALLEWRARAVLHDVMTPVSASGDWEMTS